MPEHTPTEGESTDAASQPIDKAPEQQNDSTAMTSSDQTAHKAPGPLAFLTQVGVVETILGVGLIGAGVWAFAKDQYGMQVNLMLGGGFLGIWILGGLVRLLLGRGGQS